MNRTFVLKCIEKHLAELDADSSRLRPLGELIPSIAEELRSHRNGAVPQTRVLPVSVVAAFIDGNATEEEERIVCEAILIDNSILAEITASLREQRQSGSQTLATTSASTLPPLSESLTDRLFQLVPARSDSIDLVLNNLAEESEFNSTQLKGEEEISAAIKSGSVPHWIWWSGWAAVAAAIAFAVWMGLPSREDPVRRDLAKDTIDSAPDPSTVVDNTPEVPKDFDIAGSPSLPLDPVAEFNSDKGNQPDALPETDTALVVPDTNTEPQRKAGEGVPPTVPKLEIQPKNYANDRANDPVQSNGLRWSKIQGLLARQHANEPTTTSRASKWSGTLEGSIEQLPAERTHALRLKTFPGSHAQASLTSGGKMVINGDSSIEIKSNDGSAPDYLSIEQGAIALIDFPKDTRIEISFGGNRLATLEWESKASVVLGGAATGLQSQIAGGSIRVNDKLYKNATLAIDQTNAQELKSTSRQLPAWVNRPTDTPMLPRAVLGQLAQADDLGESINEIMRVSSNGRTLDELTRSQLLGWRSTLEEDDLYHALGNRGPVLRVLAFKRALQQPAWSAKWQEFWPRIERSSGDAEKVVILKNALAFAQSGKRITLDQAIQIVTAMDTKDRVSRVLTDLLLRQLVGNGPAYNADGSDAENTRSIGLWRRFINATLKRQ